MNAKDVVGPTNFQPRRLSSLDSATEVGDVEADLLEQPDVVGDREAPLGVVIVEEVGR